MVGREGFVRRIRAEPVFGNEYKSMQRKSLMLYRGIGDLSDERIYDTF